MERFKMKFQKLYILSILFVSIAGCSGYRYASLPAVAFDEIDYSFETQLSKGEIPIAYIDEGHGDQTLVLVHGLASNAGFWRYVIPELSKNYRVIAVDLPGYGKSDKGDYPYGMSWYANQLIALMDELEIEKAVYVGHSMGGQIGLTLSLEHPDRLSKMVLATPAGVESFKPGEAKWLRNVFRIDDITLSGEEIVRTNLNRNFYQWEDNYEWMVEERMRMAKSPEMAEFAHAVISCVGAMLDEPTTARLANVQTETLIVFGDADGLIPNPFLHPGFTRDVFKEAERVMPNVQLQEIKECGHMIQIEKPMELVSAINSFLGK